MNRSTWLLPLTTLFSAAGMVALICAGFIIIAVNKSLPDAESIKRVELKVPLRVFSSEGLLISEFGNERRKRVDIAETPQALIDAILASEDDNFYGHGGIDISGLVRAALSNFRSGASQQGASTITMQVARNFFLTREKTYERKLREVLLSLKLEQILSKDEILELYLNKIFLGHRSYGFGAAADVYYDKTLDQLSLAEFAMLAGLPKAPSSNNPISNPERSIIRRDYVLSRMLQLNKISQQEYEEARVQPITAKRHGTNTELAAPHIAEMVRAQLTDEFGDQAYWAGLNVYTTIQAKPQNTAQQALRVGLKAYDKRHGFRGAVTKVNLDRLAPTGVEEAERNRAFGEYLSQFPKSFEQVTALITQVTEEQAVGFTQDYGVVILHLDDARWARRHLTADRVGDPPKAMTDILVKGDVVYIEPLHSSDKEPPSQNGAEAQSNTAADQSGPQRWQLSQIPNIGGALISIEPNTGRVLALLGGYDFFLNKYNRAVQSIRQPGSNIKPFIYSASLDQGYTPATLISGAPIVITDATHGTVWRPENYSGKFFGPTRMREALAKSLNLVSIRLLRGIGIPYTREYLERFGLDMTRFSPTLTMALGSGGVTPMELLGAYAAIANSGYRIKPYFIDRITDRDGREIFRAEPPSYCDECYQAYLPKTEAQLELEAQLAMEEAQNELDQDLGTNFEAEEVQEQEGPNQEIDLLTAALTEEPIIRQYESPRIMNRANNYLLRSMLKDVIRRGTARKANVLNRSDLAGKTGTTNDYVDAWFTGFNSQIATTVWVGFDEPATMGHGEAGSVAALPIWIDYMSTVLKDIPQDSDEVPEFMEKGFVDRETGKRTDELDPNAVPEYFPIVDLLPEPMGIVGLENVSEEEFNIYEDGTYDPNNESALNPLDESDLPSNESLLENQDGRIIEDEEETEGLF